MKSFFLILFLWITTLLPYTSMAQGVTAEASAPGIELKDPYRGFFFKMPNALWNVSVYSSSTRFNHQTYYDASVSINKSYSTGSSSLDALESRKKSLQSYMPGAKYYVEKEEFKIQNTQAHSMTYEDPSTLKVTREIIVIHKGKPYEIKFTVKKENFDKVKEDFKFILDNMQFL